MNSKQFKIITLLIGCLLLAACGGKGTNNNPPSSKNEVSVAASKTDAAVAALKPKMLEKPIAWNDKRKALMREYSLKHYGMELDNIVPRAIILHWTAANDIDGTYSWFYPVERDYKGGVGLNVGSHYLVGRDGEIWQLTPETALNRHAIGFNWCAIGIENVGGVDGKEDLTEEQVKANIALVKYLATKYTTIQYVFGHYQQTQAQKTKLYIEKVSGYGSDKVDPGPSFMGKVHAACKDTELKFFKE